MKKARILKSNVCLLCFSVPLFLGMKFQSNLNEIDKFEQKSQADSSSKVYEWPSKDEAHVESKYKSKTSRTNGPSKHRNRNN